MNRVGSFHERFAKRRMRMNGIPEGCGRPFELHRGYGFGNEVGRVGTDDMNPENLVGIGVRNDLDKPAGFPNRHCLSQGGKREFPDPDTPISREMTFCFPWI
jgi:hypothetical protein